MKAAAKVSRDDRAALLASIKASVREGPSGLDATQVQAIQTIHFTVAVFEDYFRYEECRHLIFSMWSLT